MQCRDLIVEVVPALVETAATPGNDFIEDVLTNDLFACSLLCQVRGNLQQIQGS